MTTPSNLAFLSMVIALTLSAQTPGEPKELANLRQSWQRATQQATAPINRKYEDALEGLKLRYTKEGKLAEALAVDAELKKITLPADAAKSADATDEKSATLDEILGTWTWNSGDKTDQSTIQFEKGGIGNHGGRGNITWRVGKSGDVTITHPSKGKAVIHLSPDAKSISGAGYDRKPVSGTRVN